MVGAVCFYETRTGWIMPSGLSYERLVWGLEHCWEESFAFFVHSDTQLEYSTVEDTGYDLQSSHDAVIFDLW